MERLLKSHSTQYKERIIDISNQLTEKNIIIPLVSNEARDYQIRIQRTFEEANRKLQSLDHAINDVQNWEKQLFDLKEWIVYMDKYLTTRVNQDIFADDVPDDAAKIQDEFTRNESVIKELENIIHNYNQQGKVSKRT